MTTKDIEEIAVDKVNEELRNYIGMFDSHISKNDKTAFWDGEIWLYNNKNKTKKDFEGKIAVQVKGKSVKKIGSGKSKYSIDIDFLKGYQKVKSGTLLFVVEIVIENERVKEYQIYYRNLLPVDLDYILKRAKDNQKTISIDISPIKENSSASIKNVCVNFKKNSDRQLNIQIKDISEIKDIDQINFYADCERQYLDDFLVSDCVYTYVTTKNNEKIALPKAEHTETALEVKCSISVEGTEHFDRAIVVKSEDYRYMLIGRALKIYEGTGKFDINLAGNIYERARDIVFLKHFLEQGRLKIDEKEYEYDIEENKKQKFLEQLAQNNIFINKAIKVFEYFNIKFDMDLTKLSDKDFRTIEMLADALEGNFPDNMDSNKMYYIVISKYKLLIVVLKKNDGKKVMLNFFGDAKNIIYMKYNGFPISIYINLKEQDFLELSNFDADIVKETFETIGNDPDIIEQTNLYTLEILKAYDKNRNVELLNLAEYINTNILKIDNSELIKLNRYQILYRKGNLRDEDINELYEIRESSDDNIILLGVAILLENKRDCKRFIDKLNPEELDYLKQFPIWNLYKRLS